MVRVVGCEYDHVKYIYIFLIRVTSQVGLAMSITAVYNS